MPQSIMHQWGRQGRRSLPFPSSLLALIILIAILIPVPTTWGKNDSSSCYVCDDFKHSKRSPNTNEGTQLGCLEADPPPPPARGLNNPHQPCINGCIVWERVFDPAPHGMKGCYSEIFASCFGIVHLLPENPGTCRKSMVNMEELFLMEKCFRDRKPKEEDPDQDKQPSEKGQGSEAHAKGRDDEAPPGKNDTGAVPGAGGQRRKRSHDTDPFAPPVMVKTRYDEYGPVPKRVPVHHRHHHHRGAKSRSAGISGPIPRPVENDGVEIRDIKMKLCWCDGENCNSQKFTKEHFPSVRQYLEERASAPPKVGGGGNYVVMICLTVFAILIVINLTSS